jgi:hypothetical protein
MQVLSPPTPQSVRPSTSCPADMARLKKMQGQSLNEEELRCLLRERQKKDNHNMSKNRAIYATFLLLFY